MRSFLVCLTVLPFFVGSHATADDYILIVGGGPNPFNNQVSLESNVLFAQRVLKKVRADQPAQRTYFADGRIDKPDLQYSDPDFEPAPAVNWMSRIFGDANSIQYRYRDHSIEHLDGPTRKGYLKQAFFELAEKLGAGDRLIVYVTAHGGGAEVEDFYGSYYDSEEESDVNEYDTTIALWGDDTISVSELDRWLNKFSTDVRVVLIMAQCHSGGFAHAIFHNADEDHALNPQLRAGFFSQRHDRAAAGCTPDIDESTYQEYSTFFWEALGGMTRGGELITPPDFDGDGNVSFSEAHAHAIIASESIDIPLTTSDAFLRKFSEIAPVDEDQKEESPGGLLSNLFGGGGSKTDAKADEDDNKRLDWDQTLADIVELARPEQVAVISTTRDELNIETSQTVAEVRKKAQELEKAAEDAEQLWATAMALVAKERSSLAGALAVHWPGLGGMSYSPQMDRLTGPQNKEFIAFVESQPQCSSYLQATERVVDLHEKMDEAQQHEAKMRRLLRTLENVLLEKNLHHHASEAQVRHFERLMALENEGIWLTGAH